jgi:hypothetical protein
MVHPEIKPGFFSLGLFRSIFLSLFWAFRSIFSQPPKKALTHSLLTYVTFFSSFHGAAFFRSQGGGPVCD